MVHGLGHGRAFGVPRPVQGAADVLLVAPAVHHPQVEQVRHRARSVGVSAAAAIPLRYDRAAAPAVGQLPRGTLRAHQRRTSSGGVDPDLIGPAQFVLHVRGRALARAAGLGGPAAAPRSPVRCGTCVFTGPPWAAGRAGPTELSGRPERGWWIDAQTMARFSTEVSIALSSDRAGSTGSGSPALAYHSSMAGLAGAWLRSVRDRGGDRVAADVDWADRARCWCRPG